MRNPSTAFRSVLHTAAQEGRPLSPAEVLDALGPDTVAIQRQAGCRDIGMTPEEIAADWSAQFGEQP